MSTQSDRAITSPSSCRSRRRWPATRWSGALRGAALAILLAQAARSLAQTAPTLDVLHTFAMSDGAYPSAPLIQGADGFYYGDTDSGGSGAGGTIFKIGADGTFDTLYNFGTSQTSNATGQLPTGALVEGMDGNFYGTTQLGGSNGYGSIFSLSADGQTLLSLYGFSVPDQNYFNMDGASPQAGLIQARDGNFYGAARSGGTRDDGTLFEITPDGMFTELVEFNRTNGAAPSSPLLQATNGYFYLTTYSGGPSEAGNILQYTPAGILTDLHDFIPAEGESLNSSLIEASDHNFYGTATYGGTSGYGAIYKITPSGTVTDVYSFSTFSGISSALIQASDGNFYGTTVEAGANGVGSIFQLTPQGLLTTIYSFSDGADSGDIGAGLIQGSDGNFYGVASQSTSGPARYGTVFRLNVSLPSAVQFNGSIYSTDETAGTVNIRVNRIGGTGAITVDYRTDDESAVAGTDYQSATGTLSWVQGDQTPKYIPVQILNRNVTDGSLRTLALALSNPTGGPVLGHPFTATLTIKDAIPGAPVITSATSANGTTGQPFTYQITASGSPTRYGARGLPGGLSINATTGLISGTPKAAGTYSLTLNASNAAGKGSAPLTVTIAAAAPGITSATTAAATTGQSFSYQITATGNPTSYGVQGLPGGLSINGSSGLISGTPKVAGTYTLTLNAYNAVGKGSATLKLTVALGPPVVTSATTASGKAGTAFSYQITASGSPTSYGVQGLPGGVTVNASTGLISGTPKAAGTYKLTLNCYNSAGKGSGTLMLTVSQ